MRFRMTPVRLLPVVLAFASALQAESFSRKVDPWVLQKSSRRDGRVPGDAPDAGRPAGRERAVREGGTGRLRDGRAAFGRGAVAEAAPGSSGEPRHPAPVLLGRQHDLGPRRPQPRRRARGPRGRVPHLRQSERPPRRSGRFEPGRSRAVVPRRHRMGRGQGPRAGGLGARIHGRGHRRRRPGHRLRVGPSRDQEQVPGLAGPRLQPQLQLARFDPLGRRLLRPGFSRAVRRPSPRHAHHGHDGRRRRRFATRSAWLRERSGSAAATWTWGPARPRPTRSASSGSSPRRTCQNQNPDPSKAPHVINNSWGCPPSEGCTDPTILQAVVENTRAAGIEVVVSAGNAGSVCETVADPPAIYEASFSIGATDSARQHRGLLEPRAGDDRRQRPHEAGRRPLPASTSARAFRAGATRTSAARAWPDPTRSESSALLLSAYPQLIGDPDAIEPLLTSSAVPRTSGETCGGVPGSEIPNNTFGWGRADALAAIMIASSDVGITQTDAPDPTLVGVPVTYTLTVTNHGPGTAFGVVASEGLSLSASVDSATPSQGGCTLLAHGASCDLGSIANGASATVVVVGTPSAEGTLTSNAAVVTAGLDTNATNNSAPVQTTVAACPFAPPTIGDGPLGPGRDGRPDRVDELGRRARPRVDAHRRNHHRRPGHTHADLRVGSSGNDDAPRAPRHARHVRGRGRARHDRRQLRGRPFRATSSANSSAPRSATESRAAAAAATSARAVP